MSATDDLGCEMLWGPLCGQRWRRPVDDGLARIAFAAASVALGDPVHLYESHGAGKAWLYLGHVSYDGGAVLFGLRQSMAALAQQDRTEGPE